MKLTHHKAGGFTLTFSEHPGESEWIYSVLQSAIDTHDAAAKSLDRQGDPVIASGIMAKASVMRQIRDAIGGYAARPDLERGHSISIEVGR